VPVRWLGQRATERRIESGGQAPGLTMVRAESRQRPSLAVCAARFLSGFEICRGFLFVRRVGFDRRERGNFAVVLKGYKFAAP
jgi:hypothetical protein